MIALSAYVNIRRTFLGNFIDKSALHRWNIDRPGDSQHVWMGRNIVICTLA